MDQTLTRFEKHSNDFACRVAEQVILERGDEVALLRERIDSLERDAIMYRALAEEALVEVGRKDRIIRRLQEQQSRLREEFRAVSRHKVVAA